MKCRHCNGTGIVPDWRTLGAHVRKSREAQGLGLREVARRAGCSPCYVSDMERGTRAWNGPKAKRVLAVIGVRQ